ncbi:acetyl-CoA sensor PanZ family protein [Azomonas macrocytogenes]|uniref:GNAT superfamily N-acetyltransferase n=1 Tax=Azomonas macrocytogenes TaxID=69962 RepID=A0A839T2I2_AZOMA|nr:acetyl-CoA sensor PanZ family protein [Azomonas macrocytogenes]MBB3102584.1 GNAT superfamily N-acetyltransferase [Azomonas macrocytogenes]
MPVLVETITKPCAQDRNDLLQIFADAPAWLLAPHANAEALIEASMSQGSLIAGRFNGRLLGAALLQRGEQAWQLSHLCVRKITRRRGVAKRLLDEACRLAREAGLPLSLMAADRPEVQAFAARMQLQLIPT